MKRLLYRLMVGATGALVIAALLWTAGQIGLLPVSRSTVTALENWERRPYSLDVRDRHGERIALVTPPGSARREYLSLAETPALLVDILVASEDRRFLAHRGVDSWAVVRAALNNFRAGRPVSGASTITMQLSRTIRPHSGGLGGKLQEAWTATELERLLPKPQILEMWLNSLPFGTAGEGISSGSRTIFGRPLHELTAAEMALLAVVPRNPSVLHPGRNPETTVAAAARLVNRVGLPVTLDQLRHGARGATGAAAAESDMAPHFVRTVIRLIPADRWATGEPLITSLDRGMQLRLANALAAGVRQAADQRIAHAAALVIDNRSGEILAWVGSPHPWGDSPGDQIDGVRVRNPSGSTLKPFLYALSLDRGFNQHSLLPDRRMQFGTDEAYLPVNFSRRFSGRVPLRTALASSLNVPAVYLTDRMGIDTVADLFSALGFSDADSRREQLGYGIAVGNTEVSLLELVRAFSLFPRGGTIPQLVLVPPGSGAGPSAGPATELSPGLSVESVALIGEILGNSHDRAPGFGVTNRLSTPFAAMFKTGTANQFSDIWAVGAIPELTAGVWMGNHQGRTVSGQTGSGLPASILVEFLAAYARPDARFPASVVTPSRVGPADAATLLYPGNGAVFLYDPRLGSEDQGITIEAIAPPGTAVSLLFNGALLAHGVGRIRHTVPLERGAHRIEVVSDRGTEASARIEVR